MQLDYRMLNVYEDRWDRDLTAQEREIETEHVILFNKSYSESCHEHD